LILLCYVWLMPPKLLILQTETHDVLVEIPFQLPHYYSSRLGIFHHHDFLFSLSRSKARSWMLAGTCQMEYSLRLRIVLGTLIFHTPSLSSANSRVSSDKTVSSPSACFQPLKIPLKRIPWLQVIIPLPSGSSFFHCPSYLVPFVYLRNPTPFLIPASHLPLNLSPVVHV